MPRGLGRRRAVQVGDGDGVGAVVGAVDVGRLAPVGLVAAAVVAVPALLAVAVQEEHAAPRRRGRVVAEIVLLGGKSIYQLFAALIMDA